ncbi:asparagine synthase-related protein [Streptomyces albogriseolus]|uniref:asparagine synthase-related protein n=1 Tax=Streptomyces TaxID=1883 RepID=UPI001415002C|nr:asparagine synthase-related protein [Streptomyces sp. GC420]MBC7273063.1 hypothetical protein [Streptomyces sp.]NBM14182.1 hypothetical protein [Streptomyces sp. GC420]
MYWLPVDDGVLWATAAAPLAAYAGAEPDPAALLSAFTLRGVNSPRPATSARCGASRPTTRSSWKPEPARASNPFRIRPVSVPSSALLVRETVTSGVTRRTVGTDRLSADLSGGIDSSVITSLAATRAPLLAVTYTDDRMGEQDDMRYAERTAASNSAITHAWVHGSRASVQHFDAERSGEVPVLARAGPEAGEEGLPGEGLRPAGRWRPCPR